MAASRDIRKLEADAPDRYREILQEALPHLEIDVSYTADRQALQIACTDGKRRLTWQFDSAELARSRDREGHVVRTIRAQWE